MCLKDNPISKYSLPMGRHLCFAQNFSSGNSINGTNSGRNISKYRVTLHTNVDLSDLYLLDGQRNLISILWLPAFRQNLLKLKWQQNIGSLKHKYQNQDDTFAYKFQIQFHPTLLYKCHF